MKKIAFSFCLIATLGAATANADEGDGYNILEDEGADYTVEFFKDNIDGSSFGANGDTVTIRPNGVRRTLLRPRTSFLRNLIRSVEQL